MVPSSVPLFVHGQAIGTLWKGNDSDSFSDDDFADPDILFDSDCKDNSESDCDEMERMYF